MAVGRDTLYVYGGMMEIKDKEITLDDLYSLNLSKLDEWKCIIPVCYFFLTTFLPIHAYVLYHSCEFKIPLFSNMLYSLYNSY